jgi:hypothetical protein
VTAWGSAGMPSPTWKAVFTSSPRMEEPPGKLAAPKVLASKLPLQRVGKKSRRSSAVIDRRYSEEEPVRTSDL